MAYEVTARRWRPQEFDGVVGQDHVTTTLKNAIQASQIAHAYVFAGPRGVGKTTIVNLMLGIFDPVGGSIDIDGIPLNEFKQDGWLSKIGAGFYSW